MTQASTERWGMHFAKRSSAVQCCWVLANLCEKQIFIGILTTTKACCEPVLQEQH